MGAWEHENMGGMIRMDDMERLERIEDEKLEMGVVNEGELEVAAINAALNSFNKVLLANHIRTCVAQDIREGKEETIDELVKTLQKLMK